MAVATRPLFHRSMLAERLQAFDLELTDAQRDIARLWAEFAETAPPRMPIQTHGSARYKKGER
jgi:hypothetical protein